MRNLCLQVKTQLIEQMLDELGAAYNALQLTENMAGLEGSHIPIICPELSTSRVLTMEYIDGFFHAEPHPSNVLVNLQTSEITFLDCGICT